jgi:16S rRNA (cytosine1402-N4)-methyltransferase
MIRPRRRAPRRSTPAGEHRPVLLAQLLEALNPQPGEIAVDCTLGYAGHALALLQKVGPTGRLIGLDWDTGNLERARQTLAEAALPFSAHHANFAGLPTILGQEAPEGVDLLLADLGMSSMQVDDPERGFSYVRDGPLDMRMDRTRGRSAAELLASIGEGELAKALQEFGDEPAAQRIARAVVAARGETPLQRTSDLVRLIGAALDVPISREDGWRLKQGKDRWQTHPAARTFQALRILVNRELANLQELLRVLPSCLKPNGRAAIISFHSGEDRLVKAAFRAGLAAGHFREIAEEPLRAEFAEKQANPRSRSAKLRWARR